MERTAGVTMSEADCTGRRSHAALCLRSLSFLGFTIDQTCASARPRPFEQTGTVSAETLLATTYLFDCIAASTTPHYSDNPPPMGHPRIPINISVLF
jgi:hypothetical protein